MGFPVMEALCAPGSALIAFAYVLLSNNTFPSGADLTLPKDLAAFSPFCRDGDSGVRLRRLIP